MAKKVLTYRMSERLQSTTTATVNINAVDGNLTIDPRANTDELASGDLQYLETQGPPTPSLSASGSRSTLTVKSSTKGQPWFHFPWSACNGATEWLIHLNPTIPMDITAQSGGGNIKLDLTGMAVTRLVAGTGGGNIDVILPAKSAGLCVDVKTGAGSVTIEVPKGVAARIHAATGLGGVIVDTPFRQIDKQTYQTPDYESAAAKIEINASSGAGGVSIKERIGITEPALSV